MKGFKVFNPDWTCRGFQFEVGKIYEEDVKPMVCDRGFHFCEKASDCFDYYSFNSENKVAEVEALGEVDCDGKKSCTNKIHIIRELTWHEVLDLVNSGKDCTGLCNSGNRNSGNRNSGDWNSGNRNSGDCNSGNRNSGDWNSGNRNSGDWNSGNRNSGDWNKTSFSNGCFNTESPKIFLFNKLSDWTYQDWLDSDARWILNRIPSNVLSWIWSEDMTDEEKAEHPEHQVTGGFLKQIEKETGRQMWWDALSDKEKEIILNIPNFDRAIFKEITGIEVEQ